MTVAFALQIVWAFALIALLLAGMAFVARALQRGRMVAGSGKRLITTIESAALAQNVNVHVVRVADTYFLIGGGAAGVSLLAELPAGEIEPYIEAQRAAVLAQRNALMRPFLRFKKS